MFHIPVSYLSPSLFLELLKLGKVSRDSFLEGDEDPKNQPVSRADLESFHRYAPAALARRGHSYTFEECSSALQTLFFGALPIVGLIWWGWAAEEMLILLILSAWVDILSDAAKVFALKERTQAFDDARHLDAGVWQIVASLRNSKSGPVFHPSDLTSQLTPQSGVFIDFVMGGISTVLAVVLLVEKAWLGLDSFRTPGLALFMAATFLLRFLSTAGEIIHHRATGKAHCQPQRDSSHMTGTESIDLLQADRDRPIKVAPGLRGVWLFLLVFIIGILADTFEEIPLAMMLVVNGLFVLWGMMKIAFLLMVRGETRWLREYLAERKHKH